VTNWANYQRQADFSFLIHRSSVSWQQPPWTAFSIKGGFPGTSASKRPRAWRSSVSRRVRPSSCSSSAGRSLLKCIAQYRALGSEGCKFFGRRNIEAMHDVVSDSSQPIVLITERWDECLGCHVESEWSWVLLL